MDKVGFEPEVKEWRSDGLMDDESRDDVRDGVTSGWGGESRQEWLTEADEMNLEVDSKDEVMHI